MTDIGRPSDFTQETADTICTRIADGESLRKICADEHMPGKTAVFQWLIKNEAFAEQYARARELQAASYADEIVDIADTETDSQKARVRIDARKWHSSKLAPKKYGDKLELSGDPERPLEMKTKVDVSSLTDEQLRALASIPVRSG